MEAEIRDDLAASIVEDTPANDLFTALTDRFTRSGGLELDLPAVSTAPRAATLPER
ncbi:hypothetical protein ACIBQ2_14450 [Micromonospora sediminimaris]|uniref:hypothetical protein n=1 Tax=Micromonospora sediminimaris TaxID=547162 RepID=UPI001E4540C8|nr:hypothetical protein [Micromonospora sediminimaris]